MTSSASPVVGQGYAAGGIGTTVAATRAASDKRLRATLARLVGEVVNEVTFLGAHIVPEGAAAQEYLDLVTGEMLDAVAPHVSAIDVLCERGPFDAEAADRILVAGAARGLALHMHGNQLGPGPGAQVAVRHGAASVDHVNVLNERDVAALADSWDGERRGTATPVLQMGLRVREAVRAATLGGAITLGRDVARDGRSGRRGSGRCDGRERPAPCGEISPLRGIVTLLLASVVSGWMPHTTA